MAANTYPAWIYDGSPIDDPLGHGERAVKFLRLLKHPKNPAKGHPFQLDVWQERIVRRIYGPRHEDGTRIIKTVVLLLPRGNRKTALAAALALLHTIGPEKIAGGEVLSAASDRKQARLGYAEALGIVRADPRIARAVSVQDYRNRLTLKSAGSFYESISSDAGTQHGRTPAFVLADELHAWKKRDLWDVVRSGLPKTKGSLLVIATTAGRGQDNLAHDIVSYARKVALGEIIDPSCLPVLFETSADADWKDEAVWRRANPGLAHGYPDIEGLRQLAREAEHRPSDREAFRQLHLNVWLDHSSSPFVEMSVYDEGNWPIDLEALVGQPCWIGVDLSSNSDLTAVVAAFRDDDDVYTAVPTFFCPADNLRGRTEQSGQPYSRWAQEGQIIATPGNVVDFRAVEDTIRDLCANYDVREIAFDPHLGRVMMSNLADDGYPAIEMRQGWITMAPAIKTLERAILGRKFRHGGHPVLRWNFSNIEVETDKAGNKTFHKGKSKDKIDGAQAAAMAVGRASQGESNRSIYSDTAARPHGLLTF
ncbi:phage terminase large subunit-like protein [Rhodoligotrophos appendicifer]|uniref:terminase large subunit n=1 Tax=Rhodoligotrophos appendicifer TaxID=987056 RepID=UPI0011868D7E|nr:terminase TerL endonuclease subunit [Rhodoligotrophos appendicifer]